MVVKTNELTPNKISQILDIPENICFAIGNIYDTKFAKYFSMKPPKCEYEKNVYKIYNEKGLIEFKKFYENCKKHPNEIKMLYFISRANNNNKLGGKVH
jgi:hypothetical protein